MSVSDQSFSNPAKTAKHPFWIFVTIYALLGPVAAFAKMGTVPLIIFSILGQVSFQSLVSNLRKALFTRFALTIWVLMSWSALSFIWSDNLHILSLCRLTLVIILALLFVHTVGQRPFSEKEKLIYLVIGTSSFLLFVLLFEGATEALLHRIIRPEDSQPRDGEWVPYLQMVAARGTAFLAPLCFIVTALVLQTFRRKWIGILFIIISLVATYRLPMGASALAIVIGSITYGLAQWIPRSVTRLVFAGLACFALSAPVLMTSFVTVENFQSKGLEISRAVKQRLEIWQYSSELILERPILGHGFDTSRDIGNEGFMIEGTNWAALPLHPHNAILQIWLELGMVGVIAVCIIMWELWRNLERKIESGQEIAVLLAVFSAIATISLISFGVWQYWWIAAWALIAGAAKLIQLEPDKSVDMLNR